MGMIDGFRRENGHFIAIDENGSLTFGGFDATLQPSFNVGRAKNDF